MNERTRQGKKGIKTKFGIMEVKKTDTRMPGKKEEMIQGCEGIKKWK